MTKLKFDTILDDFQSIPKAMLKCLRYYLSFEGKQKINQIKQYVQSKNIEQIIFVGHSYNFFASYIPFYYINRRKKTCEIYEGDEFLKYFTPRRLKQKCVFCFVSHSGNSPQIKLAIQHLQDKNLDPQKIWGVSNNLESFVAQNSHFILPTVVGDEEVIGTKSYVNAMLVLYFIGRAFMNRDVISSKIEEEIRQLIFEIKFYGQDWEFHVKSLTEFLGTDYNFLYFISKGASLSTAYRGAFSVKSYARIYGEGTNIGLFLHGPYQIVQSNPEDFRCVLIIGDESNLEDTLRLIEMVSKKLGSGKVMLINNSRELSSLGRSNENVWVFEHTTKNPSLAPIFETIVLQYLLLDQALRREVIEK
ncbi:Glutamine--fructose-6-phosphate aminotransferase [isomerizing] [Candidatus Lokiarchaeum ossiferum]|uniref:Glutamine--fructose-6-phosphate aminotransferase [isomerizing] n=1 Tax=Candidatus Lokiarchaeum ossiferum TaxID=2951803 RepID=A0ABY6HRS7_9ARCH|nr:Glutamine--fructose-6-phosphate aminotransferase [isomerizing] [Candidatus Lokiarchaeum sp. B-35]